MHLVLRLQQPSVVIKEKVLNAHLNRRHLFAQHVFKLRNSFPWLRRGLGKWKRRLAKLLDAKKPPQQATEHWRIGGKARQVLLYASPFLMLFLWDWLLANWWDFYVAAHLVCPVPITNHSTSMHKVTLSYMYVFVSWWLTTQLFWRQRTSSRQLLFESDLRLHRCTCLCCWCQNQSNS